MAQEIVWLKEGSPYFLDEIENGVFRAIKAFRVFDNPGGVENEHHEDLGEMIVGQDLVETPNRNLSILVKCEEDGFNVFLTIIQECLKLASVSRHDYVSVEPFGDKFGKLISKEGQTKFIAVRPRLFKKVEIEK